MKPMFSALTVVPPLSWRSFWGGTIILINKRCICSYLLWLISLACFENLVEFFDKT